MTEPEIRQHVVALQRWLASAWRQLSDPALTTFERRELRNQMKQADAALRQCLEHVSELNPARKAPGELDRGRVSRPDLRFLA